MSSFQESYAQLAEGRSVYYCEEGAGLPLLLLHPGANDADSVRPLIEFLRDRFRCISMDRVGIHRSGWLDRPTTLEEQVEGIAAVHCACTSEPIWVFGWSSGGVFAVAYAVAHPERVRGLLLFEAPLLAVLPQEGRPPDADVQIEIVGPLCREGRFREAIAQFFGLFQPELSPETLDKQATDALSGDDRRHWERFAWEAPLVVSWAPTPAEWARLTQPALVMEGDRTLASLRATAVKVSELLPRGELATLEGFAHGAPRGAPDVVGKRIIEFVERVGASESEDSSDDEQ